MSEPSQVHAVETSVEPHIDTSYRAFRARKIAAELSASVSLYSYLDNDQGRDRLSLLMSCRRYAWFAREVETGRVLVASNSCRLRWCPICSKARGYYIVSNVIPWAEHQKTIRFMTLTLKHSSEPLPGQINRLYTAFKKLRTDKQFKTYCTGGIWFFQVVKSKDGESWHPHLHCLVTGKYIPTDWLSRKWLAVTGSSKIVKLQAVKNPDKAAEYVARYSARPVELSDYEFEERLLIFEAFHGRRLAGTWGKARTVSLSPPRKVEENKYERLGSWDLIHELSKTEPVALSILKAWAEKTPISEDLTCIEYEQGMEGGIEIHINSVDDYPVENANLF